MSDLLDFLRARLDEDEAAAKAAADAAGTEVWMSGAEGSVLGIGGDMHLRGAVSSIDDIGPHIARWDPARVLAEVEAKRRMLRAWPDPTGRWNAAEHKAALAVKKDLYRLLALAYADHPDYRQEWRP